MEKLIIKLINLIGCLLYSGICFVAGIQYHMNTEKPVDIPVKVIYTETCPERNARLFLSYGEQVNIETLEMLCGGK